MERVVVSQDVGERAAPGVLAGRSGIGEVTRVLSRFFDDKEAGAGVHGAAFVLLWRGLRSAAQGGKMIRPELVLTTHRELGGTSDSGAVSVAAAFELLHTSFLLHDDVIDGDTTRRGVTNLIGAFTAAALEDGAAQQAARAWGQAAGILAGDLLIHAAQGMVARTLIPADRRSLLLDLFDETVAVTAAGELRDVGLATGTRTAGMDEVLAIARGKTAHYSFQAPLRAGAILAGATENVLAALDVYGAHTGTAFQLRDDLLGVFGRPEVTGKSTFSDLRRVTMTPLVAYGMQTAYRSKLRNVLGDTVRSDADAEQARALLTSSGARAFVEQAISEHVQAAIEVARSAEIPAVFSEYLVAVSRSAGDRTW